MENGYQPEKGDLDKTKPPQGESALANSQEQMIVIRKDLWEHKNEGMRCKTCMWFCNMRCRKHAPTLDGYPAVFPNDFCGDHKLEKAYMREG